jgi:hypothetical protein
MLWQCEAEDVAGLGPRRPQTSEICQYEPQDVAKGEGS